MRYVRLTVGALLISAGCNIGIYSDATSLSSSSESEGLPTSDETDPTTTTETGGETEATTEPETESETGSTSSDASESESSAAICGDGVVAGAEACDDGNDDNYDDCLDDCTLASCGDGFVQIGVEACDDGNDIETDDCLPSCELATCGDGVVRDGEEECDDGNSSNEDGCLNSCVAAYCGDGYLNKDAGEGCDDGVNNNQYGSCAFDCSKWSIRCGDGEVQEEYGEQCDGESPSVNVPCKPDCHYDFRDVPQLYCYGSCSWAGPNGCDIQDAHVFCKLLTGNPNSEATSYEIALPKDTDGFACANPLVHPVHPEKPPTEENGWLYTDPRIDLGGPFEDYNVPHKPVYYVDYSMVDTHGADTHVLLPPLCTNP